MRDIISTRIQTLRDERAQLAERLQRLAAEMEQTRHMLSAYDGAISELARLLDGAPQDAADEQPDDDGH